MKPHICHLSLFPDLKFLVILNNFDISCFVVLLLASTRVTISSDRCKATRKKTHNCCNNQRQQKSKLPKFAKQAKDGMPRFFRELYTSNRCSLTVYKSKPNKKLLLLTSKH